MKKVLFLLFISCNAWAVWQTPVQVVFNNSCGATSNCTVNLSTPIGAGHLLVVVAHIGNTQTLSNVGATNETFTVLPPSGGSSNCPYEFGGNSTQLGCAYVLSSVGGATSVICDWSGTAIATNTTCGFYEVPYTAPSIFLESNSVNQSRTSTATFQGVDFSNNFETFINGTNDIIFQMTNVPAGTISSIDTGFTLDNHVGQVSDAHVENTFNNAPPTWTNSVSTSPALITAFSFGENFAQSPTPVNNPLYGLQLSSFSTGSTQTVTVTEPGQFKLVFEDSDSWGIAQWYDLVNDSNALSNIIAPIYPSGSTDVESAEPGFFNRTYYDNGDAKQYGRPGHYFFPNTPRSLNVLEVGPALIVIEVKSVPTVIASAIANNIIGTADYYIYPNGKIYVHFTSTYTNSSKINPGNLFSDNTFEDPTQTGTSPPDTQGWTRASATQNPYVGVSGAEPYLFAYWNTATTGTYANYTKASLLLVHSPNNLHDGAQIIHSWGSAPGFGVVRWGWSNSDTINVSSGGVETEDLLMQLGTQGSSVLPNIISSNVAGPIAAAYIANPAPPSVLPSFAISPSTPTVFVGGSIQFTSTNTVTWSLTSGSMGSINSATGLYTAPASFQAKSVMDGCPSLPNDHVFNTRVDNLPVDVNSASRFSHMLGGTTIYVEFEESFPHNVLSAQTPTTNMVFHYTTNNDGPFPALPFPYIGAESSAIPDDTSRDQHVLGVSTTTCNFYEMYGFYPIGANPGCPTCNSGSGVQYPAEGYALPDVSGGSGGATDAAGMFIQPLIVHYSELKAGVIKHALRLTMDNGDLYSGNLWPAQAFTNECSSFTMCFPYGSRIRLKSTFNISSYSTVTQTILRAMQQYGAYITDGGTAFHFQTSADVLNDTTTYNAIQTEIHFGNIASQFNWEQVDESSLEVSSATGKVNILNPYVAPDNYAEVVATKNSDGTTASVRVALQPVTVGTYNIPFQANAGAISVMAGTPQFQIPYWVEGATTTMATCSMSPTIGTLTSGCLYTAPASQINSLSSATITITPIADSTGAIQLPITVFPSDGIRIDVGGPAGTPTPPYTSNGDFGPDSNGKYWWNDPVGNGLPWDGKEDGSFPQSSWPSTTTLSNVGLFYSYWQDGEDGAYAVMVPNGNYNLTLGFGVNPSNTGITGLKESVDTQGTTIISTGTFLSVLGTNYYTPVTTVVPVSVTNNQFYFSMRDVTAGFGTILNMWSLLPSSGTFNASLKGFRGGAKFKGHAKFK